MSPRPRHGETIDWPAVRERLQRLHDTTQTAALPVEQARAILDERARVLSRPHVEAPASNDSLDVLTLAVGVERYAIETKYVREVVRLLDFTPVPGAPDFVVGVTNYRGRILCLVRLRSILGTQSSSLSDLSRIVVMGVDAAEFGVLADRTDAIGSLRPSEIIPPSEAIAGTARQYLLGVTRDALQVLNGAQLLQDSRLFVDQRETEMP
jgi:purine-binding chemotaxis protein CheW